jgi:hypothetical protein
MSTNGLTTSEEITTYCSILHMMRQHIQKYCYNLFYRHIPSALQTSHISKHLKEYTFSYPCEARLYKEHHSLLSSLTLILLSILQHFRLYNISSSAQM